MPGPYKLEFEDSESYPLATDSDSYIGRSYCDSEEIESSLTWEHELRIPCILPTQPESQTQTHSQSEPESQILDSSYGYSPTDDDFELETLPEVVRVFREMFSGSTPPDSYFGISPKMESSSIPKAEDPQWFNEKSEGVESEFVATKPLVLPGVLDKRVKLKSESKPKSTSSLTQQGAHQIASRLLKELKLLDSLRIKKRQLYRKMLRLSRRQG